VNLAQSIVARSQEVKCGLKYVINLLRTQTVKIEIQSYI